MKQGLVHIYCGDGKGKTTAAVGLCTRAAGRGLRVVFAQFLKSDNSGEREALRSFENVTVPDIPAAVKFVKSMDDQELAQTRQTCAALFDACAAYAASGEYDLVVMDEICSTVTHGFVSAAGLADLIRHKAPGTELVLTGRNPAPEIVGLADYVTEMTLVKHPYTRGIPARKGIEF